MKNKIAPATRSTKTNWEKAEGWIACLIVWFAGLAMFVAMVTVLLNPPD